MTAISGLDVRRIFRLAHSPLAVARVEDGIWTVEEANEAFKEWSQEPGELLPLVERKSSAGRTVEAVLELCGDRGSRELCGHLLREDADGVTYWLLQPGSEDCARAMHERSGAYLVRAYPPHGPVKAPPDQSRDPVTGILSRDYLEEAFRRQFAVARRKRESIAVLLFRMDCFEIYRRTFGDKAADSCLRLVAHGITAGLRRVSNLGARFSDCHFVAVAHGLDECEAQKLAADIAGQVADMHIHHPRSTVSRFVTVSHGVAAVVPAGDATPEGLLERAERALETGAGETSLPISSAYGMAGAAG